MPDKREHHRFDCNCDRLEPRRACNACPISGKIVGGIVAIAHTAHPMSDFSLEVELHELAEYLGRSSRLSVGEARRVIAEVLNFLDELPEDFVRRRHWALQSQGLSNRDIFARLSEELRIRRFRAPEYSERQLRRIVYG